MIRVYRRKQCLAAPGVAFRCPEWLADDQAKKLRLDESPGKFEKSPGERKTGSGSKVIRQSHTGALRSAQMSYIRINEALSAALREEIRVLAGRPKLRLY